MHLTLFDLDHTLINTDSNQAWVRFLIAHGVLEAASYREQSAAMERRYRQETDGIDIAFCEFFIATLAHVGTARLEALLPQFVAQAIAPCVNAGTFALIAERRERGDFVAIITATNRVITAPIAAWLGIDSLIATEVEMDDGRITGRVLGTPSMREGKVLRLDAWLAAGALPGIRHRSELAGLTFYSDSINDLPLLNVASEPVAVNPDAGLARHAAACGWPIRRL